MPVPDRDHGDVINPSSGFEFRPLLGPEDREAATLLLLAQGWGGLHLGESLLRAEGTADRPQLLGVRGPDADLRALALLHRRRLHVLAPLAEDRPATERLVRRLGSALERVSGLEGHLPFRRLAGFARSVREVTVAPVLVLPSLDLPETRVATAEDAPELHRIYESVSWMRQDGPEAWARIVASQPTWVSLEGGLVVAAARWTKRYGRVVEVGGVATSPARRRRGAATAAVLAATAPALAEGLTPVLCFGDPDLSPMYLRLGFQRVGRELVFHRRQATGL